MKTKSSTPKPVQQLLRLDPKFGQLVLFEDEVARSRSFLPLTYLHSTHELRMGGFTTLERLQHVAGRLPIALHVRPELVAVTKERHGLPVNRIGRAKNILLINSRVLLDARLIRAINKLELGRSLHTTGELVALFTETHLVKDFENLSSTLKRKSSVDATMVNSIWEMVHLNPQAIVSDAALLRDSLIPFADVSEKYPNVHVSNPENVWLGTDVRIGAGVALDASAGPIILRDGVAIMPNAVIVGPASIGRNSIVKIGSKIYQGTSVGPQCKIGGEVENSIILGFSNKQHDGYLGHSYLGEWINLGADTNTSDLKNDYSNVRLTIESEEFDTSSLFQGLFMGDHSKSAINSQFNTGTVVGISSNLFESGFPAKWIPNFSWVGNGTVKTYEIEKAVVVARTVMKRRNKELTVSEEELFRSLA